MRLTAELRAFMSLTVANLKMYVRNPVASFSLFAVLVLILVAFKVVFTGQGPHTKVVVVNSSTSAQASVLVKQLRSVSTFDVSELSPSTARTMLGQGKADVRVTIPSNLGARDASGNPTPTQLQVTYRSGTPGESSLPILRGVVEAFNETVLNQVPIVSVAATSLHTRTTSAIDYLLPGIVTFNIIGSALMLAAGVLANYKSTGVMRRLKATGIRPSIFVLSHAAASALLGMLQTAAILVVASTLFTVHLDVVSLFLLLALGYLVFLAMGLAISGWVKDPQRATGIAQSVAFPMIFVALLASALPPSISSVTRFLPASYIADGVQHLSDGGGITSVNVDLAWLLAWAVVLLVGASRVFRWE
jgi:ABC-2 type transport system permease protein